MTGDEIVQQALRNARSGSLWLRANGYTCFVREAGFVSGWALAQIDLAHTIGADPIAAMAAWNETEYLLGDYLDTRVVK